MATVLACGVQVNLSDNQLCGLDYVYCQGTYTAEGIKALADAVSVSASLTSANLSFNQLGRDAEQLLRDAVAANVEFDLRL